MELRCASAHLCRLSFADIRGESPDYLPINYLYSPDGEFAFDFSTIALPGDVGYIRAAYYDGGMYRIDERLIQADNRVCIPDTDPLMRIAVISDLHTIQKGRCKRLLSEAFSAIKWFNADFVISAGDNTNGCQRGEFDLLRESLHNHLGGIPFYSALGNHDYFSNDQGVMPCAEARECFINYVIRQNDSSKVYLEGSYAARINGIHIIFLDCIRNRRNFRFDDDLHDWLKYELKKSESDRFRIIVNHLPFADHNLGCRQKTHEFMSGNGKLQRLINDAGRIICISGHTHNRLDSDYPSAEQDQYGNVYVNAGSIGNTQPCTKDTRNLKKLRLSLSKDDPLYADINRYFKMSSMGWLMDIHKDVIALKGYDYTRKLFIPRAGFLFQI